MRHTVDFLYSLYDALVSINVPSDKARAVVDAMERDMATTLATRQDLQFLATREDVLLVKQDLQQVRQELKAFATKEDLLLVKQDLQQVRQELQQVRQELKAFATKEDLRALKDDLLLLRQEMKTLATREEVLVVSQGLSSLRQEVQAVEVRFQQRLDLLRSEMTVRLGGMLVVSMSLLFAALKLT
jgi:hypothetical protein